MFTPVFDHSPIPVVLVSRDGSFLKVNDRFCELLGYSSFELLNSKSQNITHHSDLVADSFMADSLKPYSMIKTYISKDGKKIHVRLYVYPVFDQDKKFIHYVAWVLSMESKTSYYNYILIGISILIFLECLLIYFKI